jgi:uncharacterized membrane protein
LLVQSLVAGLLGLAYRLDHTTALMEQITELSLLSGGLALAAGAAGAQSQGRSERDSLVSGTAAGFMVAAALAPPAAVLGFATALRRWDYAALMGFQLFLQFVAIACGGWLALQAFGVRPGDTTLARGSRRGRAVLLPAVALPLLAATLWQLGQGPRFRKADVTRDAVSLTQRRVGEVPGAALVQASARFTSQDLEPYRGETLLIEVTVENTSGADASSLERLVREAVAGSIRGQMEGVVPFVDVTVLPPP